MTWLWRCRGYGANEEASGAGALRNGPLFGNSLAAALETGDAYRSIQLEAFCVVATNGLRANTRLFIAVHFH